MSLNLYTIFSIKNIKFLENHNPTKRFDEFSTLENIYLSLSINKKALTHLFPKFLSIMKQYLKISPLDKKNHAVHHKPTQIKHGLWRTPGLELSTLFLWIRLYDLIVTRIAKPAKLVDFTFVEEQVVYSQSFR